MKHQQTLGFIGSGEQSLGMMQGYQSIGGAVCDEDRHMNPGHQVDDANRMLAIHLTGRYGYASWAASGIEVNAPNSTSAATGCSLASTTAGPEPSECPQMIM